ncbi:MAG: hypothetical protein VYE40_06250 [Myxococcota bacterium]|nr:hypothetical protein [Myxococcota bacterium]MEC9440678.1 hypothetical protein [Myxococcota bacterium]
MPAHYYESMSASESVMSWLSHHLEAVVRWLGPFAESSIEILVAIFFVALFVGVICTIISAMLSVSLLLMWGVFKLLGYAISRITGNVPAAREAKRMKRKRHAHA